MAQMGNARPVGRRNALGKESKDLVNAVISGAFAAVILGYVVSAAKPRLFHAELGLLAVAAIIWVFLLVGRADATPEKKAGTIIATAVIGGLCFEVITWLLGLIS